MACFTPIQGPLGVVVYAAKSRQCTAKMQAMGDWIETHIVHVKERAFSGLFDPFSSCLVQLTAQVPAPRQTSSTSLDEAELNGVAVGHHSDQSNPKFKSVTFCNTGGFFFGFVILASLHHSFLFGTENALSFNITFAGSKNANVLTLSLHEKWIYIITTRRLAYINIFCITSYRQHCAQASHMQAPPSL